MTSSAKGSPPRGLADVDPAEARDLAGRQRDAAADVRDDTARERHLQADLRDRAASGRDHEATEDLPCCLHLRRQAAADRRHASADRHADAEDRLDAARDRDSAGRDRQASAGERAEASLDPLTGAYNRAAGFKELGRDLDRARREHASFTLAFLDVDGLKAINDARGHEAGDRALARVVSELRGNLRSHDLVIRYGGDEFLCGVVSMPDAELDRRLLGVSQALAQTHEQVQVTVGLASLRPEDSVGELLRRADAAFYANRRRR